jgi:hypothetical protein
VELLRLIKLVAQQGLLHGSEPRHRTEALLLLALLLAGASLGCLGSQSSARGYDAVYAQGLSSCAEQCRPFGVLHFGVSMAPGGALIYDCECMPATIPGEEEEPEEEEGDEEDEEEP